jgi:hypothetical protein
MKFRTTVLTAGKTATGLRIPDDVMAALGAGKKPPVRVTISGHTYRSTVATVDGQPMVGLSAENRVAAGVAGGDVVDVEIELDTAPREVEVPAELAAALETDSLAKAFFDSLSNSQKSWHTLQVSGAKTDETRQRRLEKSMQMLRGGRKP